MRDFERLLLPYPMQPVGLRKNSDPTRGPSVTTRENLSVFLKLFLGASADSKHRNVRIS